MEHRQQPAVYTIERGPGFLRVRLRRPLASRREAERVQAAIEQALDQHRMQKVLFDMREVEGHDEEVRDSMWNWAARSEGFYALALLIDSELSRIRANMTAVGRAAHVRAFGAPLQAEMWLVRAQPKPRAGAFES